MAIWIHVLCRSAEPVTYGEVVDVMGHMGWLDKPATFEPVLDAASKTDTDWGTCTVTYDPQKRPIVVQHRISKEEMAPGFEDIRDAMEDVEDSTTKRDIAARIGATQQMFVFEIPGDDLPEDVWEMLDAIEAHLARERDGVVVASEGVFDGEMNQLLAFGED